MFFSMYARGSLVILLLVTYILTDEPSNQKRASSMYVQESLFILLLGTTHAHCSPVALTNLLTMIAPSDRDPRQSLYLAGRCKCEHRTALFNCENATFPLDRDQDVLDAPAVGQCVLSS